MQDASIELYGDGASLKRHIDRRRARLERLQARVREGTRRQVLAEQGIIGRRRRRGPGQNEQTTGAHSVQTAIIGNSLVFGAKLGAWGCTGSGAMLSEAIHSFADVMNQALLW